MQKRQVMFFVYMLLFNVNISVVKKIVGILCVAKILYQNLGIFFRLSAGKLFLH